MSQLVSVIMNCCNGEKYVAQAIETVLSQTYANWELIFWDNQSTDNTANIVKKINDSRIKYFLSPKFTPLGEARNLAIQNSSGEFIAFLDSDDLWMPRKLEEQIKLFQNENVGIVVCDTMFFNEGGDVKQLYLLEKPKVGPVFSSLIRHYNLSLETLVIRKSSLQKLDHWFDLRFDMIEEYDLILRLATVCELAYVDQVLAKWRMHSNSWTFRKMQKFPEERRLMLEKFRNIFPNFDQNYPNEVNAIIKTIAKEEALNAFRNGQRFKAQKRLLPYIFSDFKMLANFLITFFPYSIYTHIQSRRGNMAISGDTK